MATTTVADRVAAPGMRPTYRVPDPFPLTLAGMMAMLGPQAINFGISVGGGEAYLLPNIGARGTFHMHWLMLVSVVLEAALVYECIKYSMNTGRSFFAATSELSPKGFWPWYWAVITLLVSGWPAWLGGAAIAAQRFTGVSTQTLLPNSTLPPQYLWAVIALVLVLVVFLPTVARGGHFGSISGYAIRRAARLLPAYWAVIALVLVLVAVVPPSSGVFIETGVNLAVPSAGEVVGHLTFLQAPLDMLISDFQLGLGINPPLWTLSLEISFYIVLPLVAAVYYRHPLVGLAIAAAIATAWHLGFGHLEGLTSALGIEPDQPRLYAIVLASDYQLPGWAFSFAAGMTAAWAYVRLTRDPPAGLTRRADRAQLLALAGVVASVYLSARFGIRETGLDLTTSADEALALVNTAGIGRRAPLVGLLFTAMLALLIVATALSSARRQWPLANRGIRWLGDISYGIYLIHFPVLAYVLAVLGPSQDGSPATFALWTALVLAVAVPYGYLSARYVERPLRERARRHGRRAEPAALGR